MVDKYLCMMDGCSYVAQDRSEALEHAKLGEEHMMVEIIPTDDEVICRMMDVEIPEEE